VSLVATAGVLAWGMVKVADIMRPVSVGGGSLITAHVATTSVASVGPQQVKTLFSARSTCSARIISTVEKSLRLSFSAAVTPTGAVGIEHPTSTTVVYTAEEFGCGPVTAFGYASTAITILETVR
jgi:hypothetical protein